jgi:ribosomal protein S18 acetylase RimI-like enzyme
MMSWDVRPATTAEIDSIARIWFDGWHEAHAHLLPPDLTRLRTLDNFAERLHPLLPDIRVIGEPGAPVGFCALKHDELYQLFVSPAARGSGAAAALVADGEARLTAAGVATAWLACAIGNDRAARFYEKHGWRRVSTVTYHSETPTGVLPIEVWRYEKSLPA